MYDPDMALSLVKQRLDRLPDDTSLDAYLSARIEAAANELERQGIHLTYDTDDVVLLVDYTVYQYGARDNSGGMPEWLRYRIRCRWLSEGRDTE